MKEQLYKRILFIPAISEDEAEKKFQLLLKGKQIDKESKSSWLPFIEALAHGATKSFLENIYNKNPHKK